MLAIYIYLAVFVIVLGVVFLSYRGKFQKYGGYWNVFKDCLLLAALWPALLPTGLLLMYKDYKRKNSK